MPAIPNTVHWARTALPETRYAALTGAVSADVVVVGGGLTGLRTAIGLAEAGVDVVLLEANAVAHGASGRSGGQCNPIWRQTPDQLRAKWGPAQADRLITTTLEAADALFADIARYEVDCDAEQHGWVQAAHTHASRRTLDTLGVAWGAVGADIAVLEGTEVAETCGSPAYRYALFHRRGGHVHPLSLSRGYAAAASRLGARLHCDSPVSNIAREGASWRVSTTQGTVTADQVVLATNAYTPPELWPTLASSIVPMVSICLATEPLPEALRAEVLPGRVTLSDCRLAIYYTRYDRDNRLIFGCIGSSEQADRLGGTRRLLNGLHTVFPQLTGIGIECAWGGHIAMTPDMMPKIHEPAPGVTAGLGFSGRGIAMSSVMGRALAARVLGGAADALPFLVTPLTPIPFHRPISTLVPLAPPFLAARDALHASWNAL
ncbi:MAG: FAD-dependent oxidoreductase [Pseudomonadota bacterium]